MIKSDVELHLLLCCSNGMCFEASTFFKVTLRPLNITLVFETEPQHKACGVELHLFLCCSKGMCFDFFHFSK